MLVAILMDVFSQIDDLLLILSISLIKFCVRKIRV